MGCRLDAALTTIVIALLAAVGSSQDRPRARDLGIEIGALSPGPLDAITDVDGVLVGHATVIDGDDVRTGVTLVLPHGGNLYQRKVAAAVVVQNGYGKLMGSTQVEELGELESPIALTNTLAVGRVADAMLQVLLAQPGNEAVRSLNVVVGETNDGRLSNIRKRFPTAEHVRAAFDAARTGTVAEGCVGAGTGTSCLGFKGGIGTASRVAGDHTVGVLVQSNFGGVLTVQGRRIERERDRAGDAGKDDEDDRGSCMIVVATDAPLCARNLKRLARRSFAGMARVGASFSNGSGDYAIAFSTAANARTGPVLGNERMSPLFVAVADATEEAILNSLLQATTTTSRGRTVRAVPLSPFHK